MAYGIVLLGRDLRVAEKDAIAVDAAAVDRIAFPVDDPPRQVAHDESWLEAGAIDNTSQR